MEKLIRILGAPEKDEALLIPIAGSKKYIPARSAVWARGCKSLQASRMFAVGDGVQFEPCSDEHDSAVAPDGG
jgi:hypothetical protein